MLIDESRRGDNEPQRRGRATAIDARPNAVHPLDRPRFPSLLTAFSAVGHQKLSPRLRHRGLSCADPRISAIREVKFRSQMVANGGNGNRITEIFGIWDLKSTVQSFAAFVPDSSASQRAYSFSSARMIASSRAITAAIS